MYIHVTPAMSNRPFANSTKSNYSNCRPNQPRSKGVNKLPHGSEAVMAIHFATVPPRPITHRKTNPMKSVTLKHPLATIFNNLSPASQQHFAAHVVQQLIQVSIEDAEAKAAQKIVDRKAKRANAARDANIAKRYKGTPKKQAGGRRAKGKTKFRGYGSGR